MRNNGPFNLLNIEAVLMIWFARHSLGELSEWIISIMRPVCEPFSQGVDFRETTLTSKLQNGREKLSPVAEWIKAQLRRVWSIPASAVLPSPPNPVRNFSQLLKY